ncbi:hypothetical protein J5N97_007025 [Dioscorea zingiberensis]|uniref:Uncharacterized protein n=1 Tax=Dioscorea zingiberensis TaxID=325984 RepID=A0A9D5HTU3_9LILI|nr:hypothetical protein J5N97_007025 [Dioscorea zingiberensis]
MAGAKREVKIKDGDSEVDQLLRQAEDDVLLKLSVNAHTVSDSSLDSDLARRFQALKSPPALAPTASKAIIEGRVEPEGEEGKWRRSLGDDLSARFAALKGCSSEANKESSQSKTMMEIGGSDVEDDEVEKVMRWAVDAARLDPSRGDHDDDKDAGASDDEDGDEDEEEPGREERSKGKGKPKKWFFF